MNDDIPNGPARSANKTAGPSGITDLARLLAELQPSLSPELYCFTSIDKGSPHPEGALMAFEESEGTTLILPLERANAAHIEAGFLCQKITLMVPSSLEAIGMMAAIAEALTQAGVPCNVVAGYHHDHLFVAPDQAEIALEALRQLQARSALD